MANDNSQDTMLFKAEKEDQRSVKDVLFTVYEAMQEKGYNPINQMVGYLLSGDPAYITSHGQARTLIRKIERDDILEELLKYYLK